MVKQIILEISDQDNWKTAEHLTLDGHATPKEHIKHTLNFSQIYNFCNFSNITIDNLNIDATIFSHCEFENIAITESSLKLCVFSYSKFSNCKIFDMDFPSTNFFGSTFTDITFEECNLSNARFLNIAANNINFIDCNIYNALFDLKVIENKQINFKLCNEEESYYVFYQ